MDGLSVARVMGNFFHTDVPLLIAVSADAQRLEANSGDGPFHHRFLKPLDVQQILSLIESGESGALPVL